MLWDIVLPVVGGGLPGAVSAQQLVVLGELVAGPDLVPLPVTVLHHRGVLHEGHVAAALHQAAEGAGVAVVVLQRVPGAVGTRLAVTQVAHVPVVPVVVVVVDP